jgi:hypothetical protein
MAAPIVGTVPTVVLHTILARVSFVHSQPTTVHFLAIQTLDSPLTIFIDRHANEPEPFAAIRVSVNDYPCGFHLSEFSE